MTTLNIAIDTCMLTDGERYTLREELAALRRDAEAFRCISPIDAEEFAQLQTLLMRLDPTNRSGGLAARAFAAIIALHHDAERYRKTRAVACETDEKVLDALEHFIHTQEDTRPDPITPEAWDAHVDAVHAMHERLTRAK